MDRKRRGFYDRLALGGFLFVPASLVVIGVLMAATRNPMPFEQAQPLVFLAGANLALAVILFLVYRWTIPSVLLLLPTVVVVLASLGFGAIIGGLAHPDSFYEFVPYFAALAGVAVGFAAMLVALVKRLRGTNVAGGHVHHVVAVALVIGFVLIAAASGVKTEAFRQKIHVPHGAIVVYAERNRFHPSILRAKEGKKMEIVVVNRDPYSHNLTPEASDLEDDYIGPYAVKLIAFTVHAGENSSYERFSCTVTGHGGMAGKIYFTR